MTDKALSEFIRFGEPQDVVETVQKASVRLGKLATHIHDNHERTELTIALQNLAAQMGHALSRLARNHDQGHDLVAWCTRNAFELNLLVRFVLKSDENIKQFLAEAITDEKQVLEGFLSLSGASPSQARTTVESRIEYIDAFAKEHGLALSKPMQISRLATHVGCSEEYSAMFKFMSKYVHPSSWLINRPSCETQSDVYWNILVIQTQKYAIDAENKIRERLGIEAFS